MGTTPAALLALPTDDLIDVLVNDRWQRIIDGANAVYALPDTKDSKARSKEIRRLERSTGDDDRYVAGLVRQWLRP